MRYPFAFVTVLATIAVASVLPVQAVCNNPRIISSDFPRGSTSYVHTPGVLAATSQSSVTDDFEGFFWAIGDGDPLFSTGLDNGLFLSTGEGGWIRRPTGYPAYIHTEWSSSRFIDGCIDDSTKPTKCTAVLLSDQFAGRGYFALVTATSALGNYSLAQDGDAPIMLSAIAKPQMLGVGVTPQGNTSVTVSVAAATGGTFLDVACPSSMIVGYRLHEWKVNRGAPAPSDLRRLQQSGGWTVADGGEGPTGQALSLGTATLVTSDCDPSEDLYLAASLVFESGFETSHLSEPSDPVHCVGQ